jgi:P27 family predicted phage terminase small subunit
MRKPRPTHLRALEGVREDRLNRDEPIPERGEVVPPVKLPPAAQAVWDRLAPDLITQRVLTPWDVDAFAAYCAAVALWKTASAEVLGEAGSPTSREGSHWPALRLMTEAQRIMHQFGAKFGLTPADRVALGRAADSGDGPGVGPGRLLN